MELDQRYTFDNFVVGPSSQFTYTASQAVAESPGKIYNPLYIYGGTGLGKTHLLHAIGNSIKATNSSLKVLCISSEEFTNEMIESLRKGKPMSEFRNRYRSVDILLMDDIQFIRGKDGTQEEVFHTFNTLYNAQKQIILTGDRSPRDIPALEDRLKSRFEWGLVTAIEPPEAETRVAILRKKNEEMGKGQLPDDVAIFIANRVTNNMGQLEGCLHRVRARADLDNVPLSIDLVEEVLKDVIPQDSEEEYGAKKSATPEEMREYIGNAAGDIWRFLDTQPRATKLSTLENDLQLSHRPMMMGLGWLAREDKLNIEMINGSYMVSLKNHDVHN